MRKYLLPETGNFYKANLHCHSTLSDGCLTPAQLKEAYKSAGYSIIAYTDHDILITHDELTDGDFLALHAFEMEINEAQTYPGNAHLKTCHICFIALDPDNIEQPLFGERYAYIGNAASYISEVKRDRSVPDYERIYSGECISEIMQKCREKGFFVTYNHPTWSRERYNDYMNYHGMHAFEMFNGACIAMGYEDYNPRVYDDILSGGERIYCIGADDNHNKFPGTRKWDLGVAYTMIKAESLAYRDVTDAIAAGNFYASEGPEICELYYEDGKVHIKTSAADRINCIYDIRKASCAYSEDFGGTVTEAVFDIPEDAGYFRLTVTDKSGKHATTNAYFLDELN